MNGANTWFCKCVRCGLVYIAAVRTEGGHCPECLRKVVKGDT